MYFINSDLLPRNSFYVVLLLVYVMPSFISTFVFFAFSRLLFQRCRLVTSETGSHRSVERSAGQEGDHLSDFSYDSEDDKSDQ